MGNTNGGGGGSYRKERVVAASYHTRPLTGTLGNTGITHDGVVVKTSAGNSYLIHQPSHGQCTTVTSASNMSKNWSKSHDIPVNGNKTVQ